MHNIIRFTGPVFRPLSVISRKLRLDIFLIDWMYNRQTDAVMRRCLDEESVGVDIGAYRGSILAKMIKNAPKGRHYAFEPLPHLAANLKKQFENVHIYNVALSNKRGETTFQYVKNAPAYSGLRRRTYDRPNPIIEQILVQECTLDDVIPDDVEVSFIKIDIEGGEYHALLGGINTVKRCKPTIVFEAHPASTAHYGVTSEKLYDFITSRLGMELSTMKRWLANRRSLSLEAFLKVYGKEYYYIAYNDSISTRSTR